MSIKNITPDLLDSIIDYLITHGSINAMNRLETIQACEDLAIDLATFRNCFAILENEGFVANWNDRREVFLFLLLPEVWSFFQKGGFSVSFEVTKGQLKLLREEISKLEADKKVSLTQIESLTSIIQNLYSFFPKNWIDF